VQVLFFKQGLKQCEKGVFQMRTRKLGVAMLALAMLCSAVTGCGSSTGTDWM